MAIFSLEDYREICNALQERKRDLQSILNANLWRVAIVLINILMMWGIAGLYLHIPRDVVIIIGATIIIFPMVCMAMIAEVANGELSTINNCLDALENNTVKNSKENFARFYDNLVDIFGTRATIEFIRERFASGLSVKET